MNIIKSIFVLAALAFTSTQASADILLNTITTTFQPDQGYGVSNANGLGQSVAISFSSPNATTITEVDAYIGMFHSSTTLADLLTPLLFADLSSAVGTSLRSWSNDEFDDGVAHGREARLRRWAVDSFFSAPLVRDDGVGGMRKRPWS